MHCYDNHAGKITTWFWSSGEPNLQKAYILHTETRKHMEIEEMIARGTVPLIIISTVWNQFLTSSCFSTTLLRVDIYRTEEEANRGGTGDGLCVVDLWQEKAPAVRVLCGSVLCVEKTV